MSFLFLALLPSLLAQDYLLNFEATGVRTKIDTVKVWNLTQGKFLSLIGNTPLRLKNSNSGISDVNTEFSRELSIYPNPMQDYSILEFDLLQSGTSKIEIYDVSGRLLIQTQNTLPAGRQTFRVTGLNNGIYLVRASLVSNSYFGKITSISNESNNGSIEYITTTALSETESLLTGSTNEFEMHYRKGDQLKITSISGQFTSTIIDIPEQSKTITSKFYACIDSDNNNYSVVTIGNQVWMGENLKTTHYNNGDLIGTTANAKQNISNQSTPKYQWPYGGFENNVTTYGRLYTQYVITDPRGVCPANWHVPTKTEWENLEAYLGGKDIAGGKLKATQLWKSPNTGAENSSGFSAFPGGMRSPEGDFTMQTKGGYWWSSTESWSDAAWIRNMVYYDDNVNSGRYLKSIGNSVRCVMDSISVQVPTVDPIVISNISRTTVSIQGSVLIDGGAAISEKGICFGESPNPDITGDTINNGSDTGSFTNHLIGLKPNTTYYVRAYAINSVGISYSQEENFKTLPEIEYDTVTDIDGNIYKTVVIGNQTWMAENLKTTHYLNGDTIGTTYPVNRAYNDETSPKYQWACNGNENDVSTYGRLYTWFVTADIRGVCPTDWHVASSDEWNTLIDYSGGWQIAGGKLKETDTIHWRSPNYGATNEFGFTALPGGRRSYYGDFAGVGAFNNAGYSGNWWSSNENNSEGALTFPMVYDRSEVDVSAEYKKMGFSVRCVMDEFTVITDAITAITQTSAIVRFKVSANGNTSDIRRGICWSTSAHPDITGNYAADPSGVGTYLIGTGNLTPSTVYYVRAFAIGEAGITYGNELSFTTLGDKDLITDIDGNVYKTVVIGNQTWMAENLKTSKYKDGTPILNAVNDSIWTHTTSPAYSWYNNEIVYKDIYGGYYNWYTVQSENLCPTDWHLPSTDDWNVLSDYLGGHLAAGGKLKETSTLHWLFPNAGATNESGFSAVGAGCRTSVGSFAELMTTEMFWTSTENEIQTLHYNSTQIDGGNFFNEQNGYSVRCVKD